MAEEDQPQMAQMAAEESQGEREKGSRPRTSMNGFRSSFFSVALICVIRGS
jgi:hypothetical protein